MHPPFVTVQNIKFSLYLAARILFSYIDLVSFDPKYITDSLLVFL